MAQAYVPGPCPLYVGLGSNNAPLFLGFSADGVTIQFIRNYVDYYCDLGGSAPVDRSYSGETARVSFDLARWDESVLELMRDTAGNVAGSAPGLDVAGEIGSLLVQDNIAYPLWIKFPYNVATGYSTMVAGYRFPSSALEDESQPQRGARPSKIHVTMTCMRQLDMSSAGQNVFGLGKFLLYDHDMTAVNGVLPS